MTKVRSLHSTTSPKTSIDRSDIDGVLQDDLLLTEGREMEYINALRAESEKAQGTYKEPVLADFFGGDDEFSDSRSTDSEFDRLCMEIAKRAEQEAEGGNGGQVQENAQHEHEHEHEHEHGHGQGQEMDVEMG